MNKLIAIDDSRTLWEYHLNLCCFVASNLEDINEVLEDNLEVASSQVGDMSEALKSLLTKFGLEEFREFQLKAFEAFHNGFDFIVIQSTASGKSLCFQVSALLSPNKFVMVICPTVALMEEQLACLKGKGIDAVILGPSAKNPSDSVHRVFHGNGHLPRLVYVTPEYLIGVVEQAISC